MYRLRNHRTTLIIVLSAILLVVIIYYFTNVMIDHLDRRLDQLGLINSIHLIN